MKPIITQYNQKSLNNLCILGLGFLIGGNRLSKTAITGIRTPKFPAELDAFNAPNQSFLLVMLSQIFIFILTWRFVTSSFAFKPQLHKHFQ